MAYAQANQLDLAATALEDGDVTEEEYRAGVDQFLACMEGVGFEVFEPVPDPVTGWGWMYDYRYKGTAEGEAVNDLNLNCYRNLEVLDPSAQASLEELMDPPLLEAVRTCMAAGGHETTGSETNAKELANIESAANPEARGDFLTQCVFTHARQLYPDLRQVTVAF